MTDKELKHWHGYSDGNKSSIEASELCGCFHCCNTFTPGEVKEYVGVRECALCPMCGIDSVLAGCDAPITREGFLLEMKQHWFDY